MAIADRAGRAKVERLASERLGPRASVSARRRLGALRSLGLGAAIAMLLGCAGRNGETASPEPEPKPAPRTVVAAAGDYDGVVVEERHREAGADGVLGYETLSDGQRVTVVEYVHTYPEPVDT
jgi:hypothetical protein